MTDAPDTDGFVAAQRRLLTDLGGPVVFRVPQPATYAPEVALNPETGQPYDPTVVPTSGGDFAEVVVTGTATPVRALALDDAQTEPVGILPAGDMAVLIDSADEPSIDGATEFVVREQRYRITSMVGKGMRGVTYQYAVFGEAT